MTPAVADLGADRARPARRSPRPATSAPRSRRSRAGSARGSPCRRACGRPRGGTGSRTGPAPVLSKAATGEPGLEASAVNPGGASKTESRWLIQHCCSVGQPGEQRAAAAGDGQRRCGRTRPPRRPRPGRRARGPSPACRNRCRAPGSRARAARGAAAARPRRRPRPGPPESTSAAGAARGSRSRSVSCGSSSEKTPHSRIRRAISCEYWPPKSSTRTSSCAVSRRRDLDRLGAATSSGAPDRRAHLRGRRAGAQSSETATPAGDRGARRSSPCRPTARAGAACPRSAAPARPSPRRAGSRGCPRSRRWPSRSAARRSG